MYNKKLKEHLMVNENNAQKSNIRILKHTHGIIKLKCKKEGRLMGAYVDMILNRSIADEKLEEASKRDSAKNTKLLSKP
jgi:hypothetical protein